MKMTRFAALGLVLAAAAMIASSPVAAQQGPGQGRLAPESIAQIEALIAEKQNRTGVDLKIDSNLLAESRMRRGLAIAAGVRSMRTGINADSSGRIAIEVRARVDAALLQQISARGIPIVASEPNYDSVIIRATMDDVTALATLPEVRFLAPKTEAMTSRVPGSELASLVRPRLPKAEARRRLLAELSTALARGGQQGTSVGSVTSQGDNTHSAAAARGAYGVTGAGIKIGVLSDGVNSLNASVGRGDLASVTVLSGQAGSGDEGTAMLEIIHDLAPGAQLYFATAFNGIASFASNIRALRNAGCDIIVDDVFYFSETPFQDGQTGTTDWNGGIVSQAVKDVVASGALYFAAAGNEGSLDKGTSGTWEGDFVSAGATSIGRGGLIHDFGGGQIYETIAASSQYGITLHWSDPLGASASDYDMFVLNGSGTVVGQSTLTQNGSQDPYEFISPGVAVAGNRIVIVKYSGGSRFLHLSALRARLSIATAGEIHGHSATLSAGSFGVAATPAVSPGPNPNPFNSSNHTESFSSDGPRRIFYNSNGSAITPGNVTATGGVLVNKPDFTAADGVSTGVSGFTSFYGTSAAAPHAAAIAALAKSVNPSLTVAQMTSILMSSTIDIESGGIDRDSGAGILMATTAVQGAMALSTAATLTSPSRSDPVTTSSMQFAWGAVSGALQYAVYLGSTQGANDIAARYTTSLSLAVAGIPISDQPVYVRLWTQMSGGSWLFRDYTFQRANPSLQAVVSRPLIVSETSTRFSWNTVSGADYYYLEVGYTAGGQQYYHAYPSGTSALIANFPLDGSPVYVRLWTQVAGVWRYVEQVFEQVSTANQARLTAPDRNSAISTSSATFTWSAPSSTADQYTITAGSTRGGAEYATAITAGTSATLTNLPTNGSTVYVRLGARVAGVYRYVDYAFDTVAPKAALTAPNTTDPITTSSVQFAWASVSGAAQYGLYVGSTPGGYDIASRYTTGLALNITGIPISDQPLYVRLWTQTTAGAWLLRDYVFQRADLTLEALVNRPLIVADSSTRFSWNAVSSADNYYLEVGSSAGGTQYVHAYVSGTSAVVDNLPLNGSSVYTRMWTQKGGAWRYVDQVFDQVSASNQARLTSPARDAVLTSGSTTFNWNAVSGADEYTISADGVRGGSAYSTVTTASQTAVLSGLPMDGNVIYVRLGTRTSGVYRYVDYAFASTAPPSTAALTAPVAGGSITTTTVRFDWTTIAGADLYWLDVGTSAGGREVFGQSTGTATTSTLAGIALDGQPLYVRVWTRKNGSWTSNDYVFRRADTDNAALLSFPVGIGNTSVGFTWSAHPGADQYFLQVGSSSGGANYFAGYTSALSVVVNGLTLNGSPVYAQLWTRKSGVWRSVDYVIPRADASTQAVLTNTNSGDTISTSSFTFNWSSVSGAISYRLDVGNSLGSSEIFGQNMATDTSATVNGIPLSGQPLYVRIWTERNSGWTFVDYRLNR